MDALYAKGLSFVVATSLIWVAASFVVQNIEGGGLGALPLTYIANSMFSLYLPIFAACVRWKSCRHRRAGGGGTAGEGGADGDEETLLGVARDAALLPDKGRYSSGDTLRTALVVAPLWFMAQLTFNLSLSLTSVSSNTVLSSAASMFTFLGSVAFLGETYTSRKLLCVLLCMAGTCAVGLADQSSSKAGSVWGDALTVASSVFYAAYTLAIKKCLPHDEALGMSQLFGFMGLLILVGMGPVLLALQADGALHLQDVAADVYGWALLKGLFDNVLTDYLWARAVILVGPTVATLGLSIQIPIAIAADLAFKRSAILDSGRVLGLNILGATLVLAGFFGINAGGWPGVGALLARMGWRRGHLAVPARAED
mmetsp:Transcript_12133/g.31079  ORF Transcript_12133/g.31079 Transcript_12133/m.31079 type:complete len:369 (+) Transcript_12133:191-1297(+)